LITIKPYARAATNHEIMPLLSRWTPQRWLPSAQSGTTEFPEC